jgi:biopolymer transport protein ExbD
MAVQTQEVGAQYRTSHYDTEAQRFNLTPMIDCVFLILIFFMVTTIFPETELLKVELPAAVNYDKLKEKKLKLIISAEGEVDVNGMLVPFSGLVSRLSSERTRTATNSVVVKADKETPHGLVVDAMFAARLAGIEKINLATEKQREGG